MYGMGIFRFPFHVFVHQSVTCVVYNKGARHHVKSLLRALNHIQLKMRTCEIGHQEQHEKILDYEKLQKQWCQVECVRVSVCYHHVIILRYHFCGTMSIHMHTLTLIADAL